MRIEFITNASALITFANGQTLLTDPWYDPEGNDSENGSASDSNKAIGIYYGAWYNFPPLSHRHRYLALRPDFIYISHIHPDHFDPETLRHYPRDTEIWIGDLPHRHLELKIRALGFQQVRTFPLGVSVKVEERQVTIFGDYAGSSAGLDNDVNYAMDTSLYVQDTDGVSLLNVNDNTMQPADATDFVARFGSPDVALLPYSGASLYPFGLHEKSASEKQVLALALRERVMARFVELAGILRPRTAVPFAGSYVLGGSLAPYNAWLNQPPPGVLQAFWEQAALTGISLCFPMEGDVLDAATGAVTLNDKAQYRNYTDATRSAYAEQALAHRSLGHEQVAWPECFILDWNALLQKARQNLWKHQVRLQTFPAWDVCLVLTRPSGPEQRFLFAYDQEDYWASDSSGRPGRQQLTFWVDERLMLMSLLRTANWNNLEIGALVAFHRDSDVYEPTLHALMSFFHL